LHKKFVIFSVIALILAVGIGYPSIALAAKDHSEAIVGKKTYKFDWDYHREGTDVVKNSHAKQDTVSAKSGSTIGAKVFTCCGDYEGLSVSLTKDKIKVTKSGIEFGNLHNANHIGGCREEACVQQWQLPTLKKGTYSLLFHTGGEELDEYYITQIKISK